MRFQQIFKILILPSLIFLSLFTNVLSQFEPNTPPDKPTYSEQVEQTDNNHDAVEKTKLGGFYTMPGSWWPSITFLGNVSAVIIYLALFFGFASFFIGHNAGGKLNKKKIFSSIMAATIIGVISRGIVVKLELILFDLLVGKPLKLSELLAGTIVETFTFVITLLFVSGISVYFYETFTVTAKEAFPIGK